MSRWISATDSSRESMLRFMGYSDEEYLFRMIPESLRLKEPLHLPPPMSEAELLEHMKQWALRNVSVQTMPCFLGGGAYDHFIPSVVRHMSMRPEFLTSYTPYQAELSQGFLQAMFEYQSMICELTGMAASNASMYDGGTALAEAAALACQATGRQDIVVASTVHPENRQILSTYTKHRGWSVRTVRYANGSMDFNELEAVLSHKTAAVIVQTPNFFGVLEDLEQAASMAHHHGALLVASVDPIALGLLRTPGECNADIVTGEGQALGSPLSFGGPYLGFFAVAETFVRKMPGRIIGQTFDAEGNRGYMLTLQAREQHIRRSKATSNICSNQAQNALAAAVYLTVMGPEGLKTVAELCLQKAHYMHRSLLKHSVFEPVFHAPFFKEFTVRCSVSPEKINQRLKEEGFIGGLSVQPFYPELENTWLLSVTEKRTKEEIDRFVGKAGAVLCSPAN